MKTMKAYKNIVMATVLLGVNSLAIAAVADTNGTSDKKKMEAPQFLGDRLPPYTNINKYFVDFAFLYWQPDADGFDFGVKERLEFGVNLLPKSIEIEDSLSNGDLDFRWDPGFKLGFGKIFGDREQWDVFINWTWFESTAKRTVKGEANNINVDLGTGSGGEIAITGSNGDAVIPSFGPFLSGGPAERAKAKYRLEYNILDVELGRNFFLGKCLTVRPHIGVRGAFISQRLHVKYNSYMSTFSLETAGLNAITLTGNGNDNLFKGKNDYAAAGIRSGADLYWNFNNHFCVFGKASASILYGVTEVEEKFFATSTISANVFPNEPAAVPFTVETRMKDLVHRTRVNLDATIGIEWHMPFNDDKQHLYVSAAYEVNEWFQQNQLRDIDVNSFVFLKTSRRNGDLGLHGVTFDIRAAF